MSAQTCASDSHMSVAPTGRGSVFPGARIFQLPVSCTLLTAPDPLSGFQIFDLSGIREPVGDPLWELACPAPLASKPTVSSGKADRFL